MQQNSQHAAEALLNLLLDRFEAPVVRVRDITQPIDYTVIGGPSAQDDFHRVLHDAERTGGIALEQARLGRFAGRDAQRISDFVVLTDRDDANSHVKTSGNINHFG